MRVSRYLTFIVLSMLLAVTTCLAAGSTNFSGHWVLDGEASKMMFKPKSTQTMDITQKDSTMEVVETTGNVKQKHTYKLDGSKQKENVEGIVTVEICAKLQGSTMQLTSECGGSKTSQTWKLTEGGNTLQIDSLQSGRIAREQVLKYRKR